VSLRRITATLGLLAALAAGDLLRPQEGAALQADFRAGGDADTLTVSAEAGSLPKYSVRRTGAKELTVSFAPGEKLPAAPGVGGSKLVAGVRPAPGGFKILLKTSAFGYVNFPNQSKSQLNIQIFQDSVGSLWGAPAAKAEPKPEPKAEPKAPAEKKAAAEKAAPEKPATDKKAEAERLKAEKLSEKQKKEQARAEEAQRKRAEAEARREQAAQAKREKQDAARQEQAAKAAKITRDA
jgi:hypothetical protein